MARLLQADLTWTGEAFEPGLRVMVDEQGWIEDVGPDLPGPVRPLPGRALLPGFVTAHSHAFQRGLRGRAQRFPAGAGDFWSWRRAMYDLAQRLDEGAMRRLCGLAFAELRRAGFTTVGEFHYLHHAAAADADYALDDVVVAAAADAGVRLVLIQAAYHYGDAGGASLSGTQTRFATHDRARFWDRVDRLAERGVAVGVAAHSIRAVGPDDVADLWAGVRRRGLPMHMHVDEQPREAQACRAAFGRSPLGVLADALDGLGSAGAPPFTAVHCTHSAPDELAAFLERGGRVCVCPLTEADLGDGLADGSVLARFAQGSPDAAAPQGSVCIGSDANSRVSALEELRWLELGQRLRSQRRGVFVDGAGRVGPTLLRIGTEAGAAALGVAAGRIAPGRAADLLTVDLGHPALAGLPPDELADALADALVFGAPDDVLAPISWPGLGPDPVHSASRR